MSSGTAAGYAWVEFAASEHELRDITALAAALGLWLDGVFPRDACWLAASGAVARLAPDAEWQTTADCRRLVDEAAGTTADSGPPPGAALIHEGSETEAAGLRAKLQPALLVSIGAAAGTVRVVVELDARWLDEPSLPGVFTDLLAQIVTARRARGGAPLTRVELTSALAASARTGLGSAGATADTPALLFARFRRHVQATPAKIAVRWADGELSFAEVAQLCDALAMELDRRGLRRHDRLLILADRAPALVITILAALRRGLTISLVDPAYPDEYIAACAAAIRPSLVVALGGHRVPAGAAPSGASCEWSLATLRALPPGQILGDDVLGEDDPAIITFTSGTTKAPKAVLGRYGSLTYFFDWMAARFGLGASARFGMCSGLGHDPLQRDIFTPLYLGGTICIPCAADLTAPGKLGDWLQAEQVHTICINPALVAILAARERPLPQLAAVFLVGAALTAAHVQLLRRLAPAARIINLYGSTESQRAVGFHEASSTSGAAGGRPVVPLGRGMKDVELVVWDHAAGRPALPYQVGEIAIRSRFIALGYLQPLDGASRFRTGLRGPDDVLPAYMTGDLGYMSVDAGVIFAGRADTQRKINGHRVELERVDDACRGLDLVQDAATVVVSAGSSDALVAFLVPASALVRFDAGACRARLAQQLPAFMVPRAVETLAALPLTPNGKLDRRRLEGLATALFADEPGADAAPVDRSVASFIRKFVGRRVGGRPLAHGATLRQEGIDSLLFVELISALRERFGLRTADLDLHLDLTAEQLADVLQIGPTAPVATPDASTRRPDEPPVAARNLLGAARAVSETRIEFASRTFDHFCSNSYLGLASHAGLRAGAASFASAGSSLGAHGSMEVNGFTTHHEEVVDRLRMLYRCEAACLYGSGYMANLSAIPALAGPADQIFVDGACHASIQEGCAASGAQVTRLPRNDAARLEEVLRAAPPGRRLIVTEGVSSIDGDVLDLPAFSALARAFGCLLYVDESSALGQLGPGGRGTEDHFGLTGVIDVRVGSLAKAIPSIGGYAASSEALARRLRFRRGAIFSTAIPPLQAMIAAAALEILYTEGARRVERLQRNAARWREGLRAAGFDTGPSQTALVRVRLPDRGAVEQTFASWLEHGVYALPITGPWAAGSFGIRSSVTAVHDEAMIVAALARIARACPVPVPVPVR